jgi:hypothetical protein
MGRRAVNIEDIEQATGAKLEAGRRARRLLDDARNTQTGRLHIDPRQAVEALESALAERDSLIMWLVREVTP